MKFYKYGIEFFDTGVVYSGEKDSTHWVKLGKLLCLEYFIFALCKFKIYHYDKIYYDGLYHYDLKITFFEFNWSK